MNISWSKKNHAYKKINGFRFVLASLSRSQCITFPYILYNFCLIKTAPFTFISFLAYFPPQSPCIWIAGDVSSTQRGICGLWIQSRRSGEYYSIFMCWLNGLCKHLNICDFIILLFNTYLFMFSSLTENLHFKILANEKIWKKGWLWFAFVSCFLLASLYYKKIKQNTYIIDLLSLLGVCHFQKEKSVPPYLYSRENQISGVHRQNVIHSEWI